MSSLDTAQNSVKEQNTVTEKPAAESSNGGDSQPQVRDWRFWMVFAALSMAGLLGAIEATIITTALPTIVRDLNVGNNYGWIANSFFLTSMAIQPLYGQLANIWGRRYLMIGSVALLMIGSAIAGWATSPGMLISGRAVQGLGSGGVNMLIELIVCDLVPLRERSKFLGIIMGTFTVGTAIGPFLGGVIVQSKTWRWLFWLNLPVGGVALAFLVPFLQVHYKKETTFSEKVRRIDWIGNLILIPSLVSILIALNDSDTKAPWSSFRILVPLILGFIGLIAFQIYESLPYCREPTVPPRLFSNRTSLAAYILTFLHIVTSMWVMFFLPVYFQSVQASSPSRSGVQILPTFMILLPFAIVSGVTVSKFGRYRPMHHAGFAVMIIGFGLFTLLDSESTTAEWVVYQGIVASGSGVIISALLPAIQASLSDEDAAASTALFAFTRSFGALWGVTIPVAVFNNQFNKLLYRITDPVARAQLANGQAYEHASRTFIYSFGEGVREEIVGVYTDALKMVWIVGAAICGVAFLLVFVEKELNLRTELKSEYGMKERKKVDSEESRVKDES